MILFDAELYLFRAATAAIVEVEWAPDVWTHLCRHDEAKDIFQQSIIDVLQMTQQDEVLLAFGAAASFRRFVWPGYKANRKKNRKPAGWLALVQWVKDVAATRDWNVEEFKDVEADDVLGVHSGPGRIIASWDKDLLTIPGQHWRDGEGLVEVSQQEADRAFFGQVLTGDAADNYPGCPGVGPGKALSILAGCSTPQEMWAAVVKAYEKAGQAKADAIKQARCARILRPGEYDLALERPILWTPPI